MLEREEPAVLISFLYPATGQILRLHKHTDDGTIWLVATDVCNILRLSNVSYIASTKISKDLVIRHKANTPGGKQMLTWFRIDEVFKLSKNIDTPLSHNFASWLESLQAEVPLPDYDKTTKYVFEDPVIIERKTIKKFLEIMGELKIQNVI